MKSRGKRSLIVAAYSTQSREHFTKFNTNIAIFTMGLENLRKEEELKSPERRKAKKPLIEKQRRRRINESLNELKILVLQALNKDPSLYSKMEKADILDLTVNYLKSVKCEQGYLRDATSLAKYRAGYNDCAGEMTRYLMSDTGLDYHSRAKLLSQVASFCQNANLRTTADMSARAPQAPLFIRPVLTPIGAPTTTCPTIPSSVPIYPASYTTNENKRPTFPLPSGSTGTGDQLNPSYCRYLMTSSTMNSLGGVGTNSSNVWRPW